MIDFISFYGFSFVAIFLLLGYSLFVFVGKLRLDSERCSLSAIERKFLILICALIVVCLVFHAVYGFTLFVDGGAS